MKFLPLMLALLAPAIAAADPAVDVRFGDLSKFTELYFTFRGKDTRRVKHRSFSRYPRLDDPDWSKPRGAPVTMDALAAWLAQEVGDKELAKSRLLSSNEFTGSQEAREYWAKYVQDHYDDLREYQLVKRTQPRSKLRSGPRTNKGSLIAKNSPSSRAARNATRPASPHRRSTHRPRRRAARSTPTRRRSSSDSDRPG